MIDPMVSLAFSVYSNKGVYALLLGSGVSRSSEIPTGWEVVLDLIRKVAALEGEDCGQDPADWFRMKHKSEPNYSELLGKICQTAAERQQMLREYFEPNKQERERGLKLPTGAHRAIAELVAAGYFRVIVTTNFDRLTEMALQDVGIIPTVVSTNDQMQGALPLVHSGATVVKVHGDYLDTRIKNTESEVAAYDPALNSLLDTILDQYGFIICGWSGEWDAALRKAIERSSSRRFTTFWARRSPLQESAQRLADHRKAVQITIKDADDFFGGLKEKVKALEDMAAPHPLSAKMSIETVKRYVVDAAAHIRLHDFVRDERERVYAELAPENLPAGDHEPTHEEIQLRGRRYETIVESLVGVVKTGCFWGDQSHADLWVKAIERISSRSRIQDDGFGALGRMRMYPALLVLYAGGIAAVTAEKYGVLAPLLMKPRWFDGFTRGPLIPHLSQQPVSFTVQQGNAKPRLLFSHLYSYFRECFNDVLTAEDDFQAAFDIFEYFLGLTGFEMSGRSRIWVGLYGYRANYHPERNIMSVVAKEVGDKGDHCSFLQAGLFGGSTANFREIEKAFQPTVREINMRGSG